MQSQSFISFSANPALWAATALTVDLQDFCCCVGAGQRHMLHAAGVGHAIVSSVH